MIKETCKKPIKINRIFFFIGWLLTIHGLISYLLLGNRDFAICSFTCAILVFTTSIVLIPVDYVRGAYD